jgi:hypothetical protein
VTRLLTAIVLALALVLAHGSVSPARAGEAPRLSGPVTDLANAVDSTSQIESAINQLQRETGTQLFVLYVDTTGGQSMSSFTDDVVDLNNLGGSDALLAVATDDRTYQLWLGDLATDDVSQDEQDALLGREVEPELRSGDFAGAAIATASGINAAINGDIAGGGSGGGSGGSGGWFWGVLLAVIAVAAIAFGIYWLFNRWRSQHRSAEERDRRTGELAARANTLLLESDDLLRDAEQELGFAEAEFSAEDVAPFRDALGRAREQVKTAFATRQRLDDREPETPDQRASMLQEIIERCEAAQQLVAEQMRRLDEARDLEHKAPEVLKALPQQIAGVEALIDPAVASLERLQAYAESSWHTVQGNIIEARKRVAFAVGEVAAGQAAVDGGDRKRAATSVRASQKALGDARELLDAINTLVASTQEAQAKLAEQLPAAASDIRSARAALTRDAPPELTARLQQAERALEQAQQLSSQAKPDVLAAYRLSVEAEAIADDVLRETQEAAQAREREREVAESTIAAAEASYRRAGDYVRSRRGGGIGREARTRLSEAERRLDRAHELIDEDPRAATEEARRAQRLADDALQLGQEDFGVWGRPTRMGGGFGSMGLGIALGGILFGGGGFGGTRWGSPGRGGGMRIPGGFGGGGRSRGGRW